MSDWRAEAACEITPDVVPLQSVAERIPVFGDDPIRIVERR
jgi:hypothetical protein